MIFRLNIIFQIIDQLIEVSFNVVDIHCLKIRILLQFVIKLFHQLAVKQDMIHLIYFYHRGQLPMIPPGI